MAKRIAIIITQPHGAQFIHEADGEKEGNASRAVGNRLFTLRIVKGHGRGHITMTGEEITSLAEQWLFYPKEGAVCRVTK